MRTFIADVIYNLYSRDLRHLPDWYIRVLYKLLKDYRYFPIRRIKFPVFGKYEYSNIFKWKGNWAVYKTFVPKKMPELSAYDICNTQPMKGPVSVKFNLRYVK